MYVYTKSQFPLLVLIREALLPWKYDGHRDFGRTRSWEQATPECLINPIEPIYILKGPGDILEEVVER